ncbi:MAG TPA: hypothetical protein VFN72_03215 [Solirubrobacterales bacterium]|nr:hypothetical protein [Solirubrobacterales bacterium]
MIDASLFAPVLGHVAGVPVEETLPGILAVGAVGVRLATEWFRRRLGLRPAREKTGGKGGRPR